MKHDLERALIIALGAHLGQMDKGGAPYISHVCSVIAGVKTTKEKIVAALHDVVEDSSYTIEHVRKDFGDEIADAVDCLTKRKGENYLQNFIPRVATNPLAASVKIADLKDNMNLTRLGPSPSAEDHMRAIKYRKALSLLGDYGHGHRPLSLDPAP